MLLAIVQAQKPLVMKAFKMLELTYGTFILVRYINKAKDTNLYFIRLDAVDREDTSVKSCLKSSINKTGKFLSTRKHVSELS